MDRVIALVDMDCFYVQVEQRLNPALKGKPCAVVQYNAWKGGGIIAVGYEARACGVTRQMRGDEAKKKCPDIVLCRVPEVRGKADLTKFREAGAEVIATLSKFCKCVERASIDEAYLDLTAEVEERLNEIGNTRILASQLQNTYVVGWEGEDSQKTQDGLDLREQGVKDWLSTCYDAVSDQDVRLAVGAVIAEEMRAAVYKETGFRCSAGIAHNKMLAKFSCGVHKPNKQTVLPHSSVHKMFTTLKVTKLRGFGGKFGEEVIQKLGVENVADICKYSEQQLQNYFGEKAGSWLFAVCRGEEHEAVSARQLAKSIGCSKNFTGKNCLDTREKVRYWLDQLSGELEERLIKDKEVNNRVAKHLNVSVRYLSNPNPVSSSRSCAIVKYERKKICDDAFSLLQKFNTAGPHQSAWVPAIICLGMSAGKFDEMSNTANPTIKQFLVSDSKSKQKPLSKSKKGSKISATVVNNDSSPSASKSPVKIRGGIESFFKSKVTKLPLNESHRNSKLIQKDFESKYVKVDCSLEALDGDHGSAVCEVLEVDCDKVQNDSAFSKVLTNARTCQGTYEKLNGNANIKVNCAEREQREYNFEIKEGASLLLNDHIGSVQKMTTGPLPGNPSTSAVDELDMQTCEKCGRKISAWELPEHLDYHFALELQKQCNGASASTNATGFPSSAAKRKSDNQPGRHNPKKSKTSVYNTLHHYFSKS
ncbi:DNA polymerase eta [Lingula anatina]|uniref:DNA polymerase eta n=1 Tax=Lingula anatina TaxID=7574 RepID=A0A1S3KD68_LINAN|nr:DNA polymerase eta [Lingula anatina]|eukprot:XP_013420442.1 DNA polymerase eta [Lingula anatina]